MLGSSATNPSLKDNASSPNHTSGGVMTSGNVPHCGHWDEHIERTVESCTFWLEGVLLTATGKITCVMMANKCHYSEILLDCSACLRM